ncbi:hypothetical protein Bca4012_033787 [Brassica carinata]
MLKYCGGCLLRFWEARNTLYWVILSVSDNTGTTAFLGFDTEVAKLTHRLCDSSIMVSTGLQEVGVNAQVYTDMPRSLADSVGNTYIFQLRMKDSNFTANHQTFTISRIVPARELAPMPTFDVSEGVKVPEAALPGAVAPGSDVRDVNTCKVAEQATTPDGSLSGRLPAAKEQVDLEENGPKKARVE